MADRLPQQSSANFPGFNPQQSNGLQQLLQQLQVDPETANQSLSARTRISSHMLQQQMCLQAAQNNFPPPSIEQQPATNPFTNQRMSFGLPPHVPSSPSHVQARVMHQQSADISRGAAFPTTLQMQSLASRNPQMLQQMLHDQHAMQNHALQSQGNQQSELVGLAHNPQPQNGNPAAMAALRQMQQQAQQHQQSHQQSQQQQELYQQSQPQQQHQPIPDAARGPSAQQNLQQQSGALAPSPSGMPQQQHVPRCPFSFMELRTRMAALNNTIRELERQRLNTHNQNLTMPDAALEVEIGKINEELQRRRDLLEKLSTAMQQMTNAHSAALAANQSALRTSPVQSQQHPAATQNDQGHPQQGWPLQTGASQTPMFPFQQSAAQIMQSGPSQASKVPQMPPQGEQMNQFSPNSISMQFQPGAGQSSPNVMSTPFPGHVPAQATPPPPPQQQQQHAPLRVPIPPLSAEVFNSAYKTFCTKNNVVHDPALMSHDGRPIDLYALHVEVMNAGFYNRVAQNDQWPVIGAKLGFVQFPASNSEPAKSGPGVAQHLEHVYKQYLHAFDSTYLRSWLAKRSQQQQHDVQQAVEQARMHQKLIPVQGTVMSGRLPQVPHALPSQNGQDANGVPGLAGASDLQLNEILQYATVPTPELRRRNVPAHIINLVEANRPLLLRSLSQRELRGGVAKNAQSTQQQRPMPSPYMAQIKQQGAVVNPAMALRSGQSQLQQNSSGSAGPAVTVASVAATVPFRHRTQPVTEEELQNNLELINSVKRHYSSVLKMTPRPIPDDQKVQFNAAFEELCRCAIETDSKLRLYLCYINQEAVRKLIAIIMTAQHQRKLLASSQCIMDIQQMRQMSIQMQGTSEAYAQHTLSSASNTSPSHSAAPVPSPPSFPLPSSHTTIAPPQSSQQGLQSHPPPQFTSQQMSHPIQPPLQPPQYSQPVPPRLSPSSQPMAPTPSPRLAATVSARSPSAQQTKKKVQQPLPATQIDLTVSATPPASASTPVASASTPIHVGSSPQTPKSPKAKANKQKQSTKRSRAAPKTASAGEQRPATPAAASAAEIAVKRPREEEQPSSSPAAALEPPSKRIKTEWEDPPSEALVKKQEAVELIKTDEDAAKFLEKMTDLLKRASSDEDQGVLSSQISSTLDQILKPYEAPLDFSDSAGLSSLSASGGSDSLGFGRFSPSPGMAAADGLEFFDFTSYGLEDDTESKPETPDLVPASSTNPSPGSASEADGIGHIALGVSDTVKIADIKEEEGVDLLRMGIWGEIDGGESAYYQAMDGWKWEVPMATCDQPWAISTV